MQRKIPIPFLVSVNIVFSNVQVLLHFLILLLSVTSYAQTVIKHRVIGSGDDGYRDGGRKSASLSRPMGVVLMDYKDSPCVMISDAGNHLIRLFDLVGRTVSRIAGTPGLKTINIARANESMYLS